MTSDEALFDQLGPKGRRWVRIATVLSVLMLAGVAYLIWYQLYSSGALAPSKWEALFSARNRPYFAGALGRTAWAAMGAAAIALPLGLLLAIGRLSSKKIFAWPATFLIELFRAVPVLLIIYIFTSALPGYGINPDVYWKLVIPIGLCAGAVIAEVFRAGVLAIPKGQTEAGLVIGLTGGQTFNRIVLPQAVRVIIPSLVAQFVIVVKDTTFGYVVSYNELLQSGRVLVANTGDLVQTYLVITIVYIIINVLISRFAHFLDRRMSRTRAGKTRLSVLPPKGAAGQAVTKVRDRVTGTKEQGAS